MIKFDINFIFGIVDIIVFYLLMRKFLFGRIKKVIDKRKELIESEISEAKDKNEKADEALKAYEDKLAGYQSDGEKIIADAKQRAEEEAAEIISSAQAQADDMKQKAQADIEAQSEKARQDVKDQIAALAIEVAEKVVKNSVDEKTNSDIIDEFLSGEVKDEQ
jgi:F-type H+-transporting ATPase subunit b